MQTISINSNNDLYLDASGNVAITKDINALADISKNKVLTNYGEPLYNQLTGIPYFDTMFTDSPKIDLFQAAIIKDLENTENIQRVSKFEYNQSNGIFNYSVTEQTPYGEITLNG